MSFLSERAQNMQVSATLAMSSLTTKMKAEGKDIISLSLGEPNFPVPTHICKAAVDAIQSSKYFSYPPVAGYADARAIVAEKFRKENDISAIPEEIVISTGAKQSIVNVLLATLNPGDEVVISTPYWVSYPEMVKLAGATPVYAQSSMKDGYKLRPEVLKSTLSARSKAFIFSSPCNPTGTTLNDKDLADLSEILRQYPKVLIISDEIYEYINFSQKHRSIGAIKELSARTVTINGLSKGFAMMGWRLGYMHAPLPIAQACEKIQGQCTSAANSIAQRALVAALQHDKESCRIMCKTYEKRAQIVHELLQTMPGIRSYLPQGAYYMFPDVSAYFGKHTPAGETIANADDLCMYLLKEANIATVSGRPFGGANNLRLSFGLSEDMLREAMHRLSTALGALS